MIFELAVNHCRAVRAIGLDLEHAEQADLMPAAKRLGFAREAWEARPKWGPATLHTRLTLRLGRKTYCFEVDRPLRDRQAD
ncbi:hypothetical protein BV98_001558 [Sphingobium herbicidovorans NBRC 16415]|uniref:Uncharacterized protein n=1 Tax=Sphingobium herbicidovorans (strain ATCC 700291 / DSM 11019 / CCUG 56400 / KCTC 2939 / LMG 18315 / NBRC 16415 / MH) TaxID=1219045 RepID=A0A086PAD7_SPHHM|nr:hypothetical protein [Sphingobium herbicidovorans]KFG90355.1 hypothetical protein BV98_001558 [Sphingobium herbicidovorans NBRC 16415]